jgi:hypothetical protein
MVIWREPRPIPHKGCPAIEGGSCGVGGHVNGDGLELGVEIAIEIVTDIIHWPLS